MSQWWSWGLTSIGGLTLILAGNKNKLAWAIGFWAQGLWAVYAVISGQYGFIASSVMYGAGCARNWFVWRRDELEAEKTWDVDVTMPVRPSS